MVTDGNWPKCVTASGPTVTCGCGNFIERDQLAAGRSDVQQAKRLGVELILGQQLHDHLIVVGGRVDVGHLPRAVGVIERALDLIGRDAQRGGAVAVDIEDYFRVT